MKFAEIINIL